MTKGVRNTVIIIAVILLVFAIIFAVYQNFQTEPMDANVTKENILDDPNTGLENMLNDIFNEETINNEQNEIVENTENENVNTNTSANSNSSTNTNANTNINKDSNTSSNTNKKDDEKEAEQPNEEQMTPRETKAIELVQEQWKKDWGNLNGVSFNVSIQSDGKYGVTVYDTSTTQSIQFYIVDVDTGIVKER